VTIGESVHFYRRSKKLLRFQLAELSGVSSQTITNVEADKHWARFTTLIKLSKVLNISVDTLVGRNRAFPRLQLKSDLSFGEKLAAVRKANNLPRAVLERKADIPKKTIQRWEDQGVDPIICYLIAVADVLNISLDELA
jgi:transcriptional regulator with XRE-family HTH domain